MYLHELVKKGLCCFPLSLPGFSVFESLSGNDDRHGELCSASRLPKA